MPSSARSPPEVERIRYSFPPRRAGFQTAEGEKPAEMFRDYRAEARPCVKEFYRLNHAHQTLAFVLAKKP